MFNRSIQVLITMVLITSVFSSCKKYLDVKSNKTLVVLKTVSDLQGLLDDEFIMNSQTPGFGQSSVDDFFMTPETYASAGELDRQVYTWQVKIYNFPNDWAFSYSAIYNANYCLDHIDAIHITTANEAIWKNVKGSAAFYRGYYFLLLLWEYAKAYDPATASSDLGIAMRLNSNFNTPSTRASVKDCYKQVINDLQSASLFLPEYPVHPMRPSKPAAYAALARTYLSMGEYDSAFKYSDLSLQIKNDLLDFNSPDVQPAADVPFQPFNKEIVFYATQSWAYMPKYSFVSFQDTLLYNSYHDNDLRKSAFYFENGSYYSFKGHYTANPYLFFGGITTAELYLVRAECAARKGMVTEAMNDLNTVLLHRWITGTFTPLSASSSQEALDIILKERRKELTMRGLRWIDIKRLNREGANILLQRKLGDERFQLPPNDKRYALPLPQDIITQTGMPQN